MVSRAIVTITSVLSLLLGTEAFYLHFHSSSSSAISTHNHRHQVNEVSSVLRRAQASSGGVEQDKYFTQDDIRECAADFGLNITITTLGPGYRIVARKVDGGEVLGYTSGFVAPPLKLVHLDTMQIRREYWKTLEKKNRFPYGVGVLLGGMALRFAWDSGCRKAELLAINDSPRMHELLKKFYKIAGFYEVKEVTQDVSCIPDLLVWGGVGTRMDIEVETFLKNWTDMIRSRGAVFTSRGKDDKP